MHLKKNKIPALIFIFLVLIYTLTAKGYLAVPDSEFSLRTAKSIVEDGSLTIKAANFEGGYVFHTDDGRIYSKYGIGLALLWIPYVLAGKLIAPLTSLPEDLIICFLISFYNIFFGAGAAVLMFYIIKFFKGSNQVALVMAFLLGLATMCWRYSVYDFSEVAQMFFFLLTIYCVLKNTRKSLIIGGVSFGFLVLIRVANVIYLPAFLLYFFLKDKPINKKNLKHVFYFLSFVIIFGLFILFLNYIRFGNIFEFGYGNEALKFYPATMPRNIFRLLFSLDKGIFIYNPLLLLGILGYFKFFKLFRKETIFFGSIIVLNLCVFASWWLWEGGWSWGPRFLVITIPLYLLPLFVFLRKKKIIKGLLIFFVLVSFLIQIVSVLQNDYEYLQIIAEAGEAKIPKRMPPHIVGSTIILKHKFLNNNNIYNLSEFGVNSNEPINTSWIERYRGLNLWYNHLLRGHRK